MRWLIFLLLCLGALFSLAALRPAAAGSEGLFWPFFTGATPFVGFVGGLPGWPNGLVTALTAGVACVSFLAALAGLFWKAIPTQWWPILVIVAVIASSLLYVVYFSYWMLLPILVNLLLLWGVLTKHWTAESLPARALASDNIRVHPLMYIPVPWLYVLMYLAGAGLQYLVPIAISSSTVLLIGKVLGVVLIVAGVPLAFVSLGIFHTVHTTTVPFAQPSQLVTWGPYRFTRNPMYVGLALIYVGVAGLQAQIWPLILLPPLIISIDRVIIPVEESRLRAAFGQDYERYCTQVPRWVVIG